MAGAIAVMVRTTLRSEFKRIDPRSARVILVDMAARVLGTFAESSGRRASATRAVGRRAELGHAVDQIDENGVVVAGERIASKAVIWTPV